ncbi:MAG: hypothetical protein DRI44_09935 [Chlamydiae bacterium]|nr:MAG: hypothetical protein DRI44_09935 [Chlamydiota bacterium]
MKAKIKKLLAELNNFARGKNITAEYLLHAEKSNLIRLANSAVSLNTSEELVKLIVTSRRGRRAGTYSITTDLSAIDRMKSAIVSADEIAQSADEVNYDVTLTPMTQLPDDDVNFDDALVGMNSSEKLDFINKAVGTLETDKIKLSGIFSTGAVWEAVANTLSESVLFHSVSDGQISLELTHSELKWEIAATQSAISKSDLNPEKIQSQLSTLLNIYQNTSPEIIKTGKYDIILSGEALAELIGMMEYIGFSGGLFKRKMSCLRDEHLGKKIFDDKLTIVDDPAVRETFPSVFDYNGNQRSKFTFVENGVFKQFMWDRDSADEFNEKETGHDVSGLSTVISSGNELVSSINDIPENKELTLFIPHLHYMNIVNMTEGIITACSRFGALIFDKENKIRVPFNFRLTDNFFNIFNDIEWISNETVAVNTSNSYGMRSPAAAFVPKFIKLKNISITHVNKSF